jgi:hypothetical protein
MSDQNPRPLDRFRKYLSFHHEFLLILFLFIVFRAMGLLVFRPGGYLGEMSDFGYYRLLINFTNQGFYPLVDFWVEYPPVFPWLMVGLYRLSLLIPPLPEPGAWFYLMLSAVLLVAEAGNLTVLYALGRRLYGMGRAVRLAWIYSALLIPLLTLYVGFDGLALLFLLLAVLLTLDRRPVASGVTAGLGFMTKLVPIAALPAAWQHMNRPSQRVKLVAAALLACLLIALPFLFTGPDYLFQSLKSPIVRSTWETVWALIDGYYSYGVAGGVDRFDAAMAGAAQHPTRLPWLLITVGFIIFYIVLYTRKVDWTVARRVVAFTALTQNLLTLYFKGYSPQFLIMLLPFIILLIPGWRGIAYAVLLSAINLAEYPIYFLVLPDQPWLLTGTVLLRTLILIVVSVEYAAQVYTWRITERRWNRLASWLTALVVVLGLVALFLGIRAYGATRYRDSPHRTAMDALTRQGEPGATVLAADQLSYEQLYPFLHDRFNMALVETHDYLPPWEPRLAETAAESFTQLWIYAPSGSPLHVWPVDHYPMLASQDFGDWRLTGWNTR